MILQGVKGANKQILKSANRVLQVGLSWNFKSRGMVFPYGTATGATSYNNQMNINFSSASSIRVNYGDGTVITYSTVTNVVRLQCQYNQTDGVTSFNSYTYSSGDDNTIRNVTITILEPEKLTQINISGITNYVTQVLPIKFSSLKNLRSLTLSNTMCSGVDESYLALPEVTQLVFSNAFSATTRYYGQIPLDVIVGKKYTSFSYASNPLGGKSFADSNLDKIATNLATTLTTLSMQFTSLADNNGSDVGGLPSNFALLNLLTTLNLSFNAFTTPPTVINSIPSITSLSISWPTGGSLNTWGDFGGLINLSNLTISDQNSLPTVLPSWFSNLTKLKLISFTRAGRLVTGRINDYISMFYTFYDSNASKTGANTLPFRGVTINIDRNGVTDTATEVPSGIYQQPAGFVAGVSNGTPTTSLEKIWVLVNQYGHTWIYRAI